MKILLDTNILLRLAQIDHSMYSVSRSAVRSLLSQGEDLCIVPQNLYEFWVVATRPAGENGLGLNAKQAASEFVSIKRITSLLRDERAIVQEWERLVENHNVIGKRAHDARLVAAMHRHKITHILTFNSRDFSRFPGITALPPETVG